jgi:hypothetical protein
VFRQALRRREAEVIGAALFAKCFEVDRPLAACDEEDVSPSSLVAQKEILRLHRVDIRNRALGVFAGIYRRVVVPFIRDR